MTPPAPRACPYTVVCDCPRARFNDARLPHGGCGFCEPPDPAPDTRGDWSLILWVPIVLVVAALRWVRIRVGVALIDLGARIMPEVDP